MTKLNKSKLEEWEKEMIADLLLRTRQIKDIDNMTMRMEGSLKQPSKFAIRTYRELAVSRVERFR